MGNTTATCSEFRDPPESPNKALKKFDPRYKPVRIIGKGQFSTVYECVRDAVPAGHPQRYALKVMTCWTWDSRTLSRIEDEISIMQQLLSADDENVSHPCLVKLVDYFKERIPVAPLSTSASRAAASATDTNLQQSQQHALLQPTAETAAQQLSARRSNNGFSAAVGAADPLLEQQVLLPSRQEGAEAAPGRDSLLLQLRAATAAAQQRMREGGGMCRETGIRSKGSLAASQLTAANIHATGMNASAAEQTHTSYMWRIGLVLDYCDGGDLAEYLNVKGPLSEAEARYIISKICHGLAYLHSKRIMHRDIKPENILLGKNTGGAGMEVKISDFGLAKQLKGQVHRSLSLCGSDFYLPPEMLQQEPYDTQVDMWSMGTLCFAILFGSTPFNAEDITSLYQQIVERRLSLSPEQESSVSPGAWRFLLDALQIHPSSRLTAHKALRHRWLRGALSPAELAGLPPPPTPLGERSSESALEDLHADPFPRVAASTTTAPAAVF